MLIRSADGNDAAAIWAILEPVIRAGQTYALPPDMTREDALAYWLGADRQTLVAEDDNRIVGTYYLKPNQLGGGAHVANCGYITARGGEGRGIARRMCLDSLQRARAHGFRGMQFNFVVETNTRAIQLWLSLGFEIVGRLPSAFKHPHNGYTDALIMYRPLEQPAFDRKPEDFV